MDDKNGKKKNVVNEIVENVASAYLLLTDTSVSITPVERKSAYESNIERTEKLSQKMKADKAIAKDDVQLSA